MLSSLKTQSPGLVAYWILGFLFFVAMHYFQSHPPGDGLLLSFNTFSWIPVSFFIGFTLLLIVRRSAIQYSNLTMGLLLSCVLLLIPAFYPDSRDITAMGRFYVLVAGLMFFIGLQQLSLNREQVSQVFFLILIAVIVEAIIGYAQYFALMPEYAMGYSSSNRSPWGIFRQPNVMASFMATGLVLSAFLLPRYTHDYSARARMFAAICLLVPLFTIPIILQLHSRVGWLGALIGSGLILHYVYIQAGRRVAIGWVLMALLAVALGILMLTSSPEGFGVAATKVQLDTVRMHMYPAVLRMIMDSPLSGVGYGNFESSFNAFAANLYVMGLAEPSGVDNLHHPHNELMYWAAEGGILALGGLLLAAYLVLGTILRCERSHRLALVALFFPIVLHTQTEYPFYHSVIHWVIFVMLIYFADTLGNQTRSKAVKSTLLLGTAGVVIPVITTAFMVTTLHASRVLDRYETNPGTSPEILLSIVNPMVWRERLLFQVRSSQMYIAFAQGDISQVQPFIDLLEDAIVTKPRWQHYQSLIFAYDFLNQLEQSDWYLEEAERRFPTMKFYRPRDGVIRIQTFAGTISNSQQGRE